MSPINLRLSSASLSDLTVKSLLIKIPPVPFTLLQLSFTLFKRRIFPTSSAHTPQLLRPLTLRPLFSHNSEVSSKVSIPPSRISLLPSSLQVSTASTLLSTSAPSDLPSPANSYNVFRIKLRRRTSSFRSTTSNCSRS